MREQRQQLTMAQQHMRENMQGNANCEQCAYREMQRVMGKCELMEQRAQIQAVSAQEHREYLRAMEDLREQ